jgi:hypothetical protein
MNDVISTDLKENPKRFWAAIKSEKQESTGVAPLKNKEGFIHSDTTSKAEILNEQFQSVYTKENTSTMPDKGQSKYPSMKDIVINTKGVFKLLKDLNPQKATGTDCIPSFILKSAADELAPILTQLYQYSLAEAEIPSDWRDAHIVPLFKKGEKHLPSNYRPVSLTSIVCKLLEHIIHSNIMSHFDRYNILTDKQHGFRSRRSCETQLVTTIQKIAQNLTSKGHVDVILLDFAKAFDKVPHRRLLHKLKFYGVDGTTLVWISSFLSNRKQLVLLDGVKSSEKEVLSGVPQGTVLGPCSFCHLLMTYRMLPPHRMHACLQMTASSIATSTARTTQTCCKKTFQHLKNGKRSSK